MNYYCIKFLYQDEDTKIYSHLPCTYQVTEHLATALNWFEDAVRHCTSRYGNELISVRDMELDYLCTLKEAVFTCGEPAYRKGRYIIALRCYNHNPLE